MLTRTLNFFAVEGRAPGVAVDLGCGSGPDSAELLRRGWFVHAVDADPGGLDMLKSSLPRQAADRLRTHATPFEAFEFPACDLVWASFALPFCTPAMWPALLQRVQAAITPGGRFAGDVFGDKHAWAQEDGVMTMSQAQLRRNLHGFQIEAFDIEDGLRVSGDAVTPWHAFAFAARKPATGE